jgi:hypothetical protein
LEKKGGKINQRKWLIFPKNIFKFFQKNEETKFSLHSLDKRNVSQDGHFHFSVSIFHPHNNCQLVNF